MYDSTYSMTNINLHIKKYKKKLNENLFEMNSLEISSTLFKLYILNRPFTGLCYQA